MPTFSLLTNPLVLASHTPSMASQLYAMSSYTFVFSRFLITVHRVPPRKQPEILLRSLQSSLRIFPRSKGAPSIWQANHTVSAPIYYAYIDSG